MILKLLIANLLIAKPIGLYIYTSHDHKAFFIYMKNYITNIQRENKILPCLQG